MTWCPRCPKKDEIWRYHEISKSIAVCRKRMTWGISFWGALWDSARWWRYLLGGFFLLISWNLSHGSGNFYGRNQGLHKKIQKVYSVGNHRPYSTLWYFMYPGWNLMKPINWHLIISNHRKKQWNLNGTTKGHFTTSALSDILDWRGPNTNHIYIYIYYIYIYTYSDDCLLGSNPLENKKGSLRIILPFLCLASFQL